LWFLVFYVFYLWVLNLTSSVFDSMFWERPGLIDAAGPWKSQS